MGRSRREVRGVWYMQWGSSGCVVQAYWACWAFSLLEFPQVLWAPWAHQLISMNFDHSHFFSTAPKPKERMSSLFTAPASFLPSTAEFSSREKRRQAGSVLVSCLSFHFVLPSSLFQGQNRKKKERMWYKRGGRLKMGTLNSLLFHYKKESQNILKQLLTIITILLAAVAWGNCLVC